MIKRLIKSKFFFNTSIISQEHNPARLNYQLVKNSKKDIQCKDNLVILHGFLGSLSNFRNIVRNEQISSKVNSYLIDQRNHGDSEHRPTNSIPELAMDTVAFIEKRKLENIFLMGHSLGGRVVMSILNEYPQLHSKIKGVIIGDITPANYYSRDNAQLFETQTILNNVLKVKFQDKSFAKIREEIIACCNNKEVADLIMTNVVEDYHFVNQYKWRFNIKALAHNFQSILDYDYENGTYEGPVKVIGGEKSTYINYEKAEKEFPKVFPKFNIEKELVFIEKAGHWIHYERPYEFIKILSQFLEECQKK